MDQRLKVSIQIMKLLEAKALWEVRTLGRQAIFQIVPSKIIKYISKIKQIPNIDTLEDQRKLYHPTEW